MEIGSGISSKVLVDDDITSRRQDEELTYHQYL